MTTQLSKIYEFTTSYYSLEELRTLCFEMGVEFENLGGRTRNGKARELVLHMGRGRQLPTLFEAFQATRPNLFEEEQFDTTGEGLESAYDELDAFEEQTRPLGEKMLRRVGIEQRVGLVGLANIGSATVPTLFLFSIRNGRFHHGPAVSSAITTCPGQVNFILTGVGLVDSASSLAKPVHWLSH